MNKQLPIVNNIDDVTRSAHDDVTWPETERAVRVSFGGGPVVVKLDSGADISVLHPRAIPTATLSQARASGEVGTVSIIR